MIPSEPARCLLQHRSSDEDVDYVCRPPAVLADQSCACESPRSLPTDDQSAAFSRSHLRQPPNIATFNHGHFAPDICESPAASATASDVSMSDHTEDNLTPPESPQKPASPNAGATAEHVGQLSLENNHCHDGAPSHSRGRSIASRPAATVSKRAASKELPPRTGCQPAGYHEHPQPRQSPRDTKSAARAQRRAPVVRQGLARVKSGEGRGRESDSLARSNPALNKLRTARRADSGYASFPSPRSTVHCLNKIGKYAPTTALPAPIPEHPPPAPYPLQPVLRSTDSRYPGLILQPDSSPISLEQLAAEIKGIYAGLVMVEAKCMSIDKAQAGDPKSHLGPEQWAALIALHRTLLYEHHDFLMATQHPLATQALRGLATKYNMPARMWKHGIHAFLEVLRHRRPASQDYMLAFIYLAYQMMALLLETVPSFTDTWIECLGDLARYRMAIEDEKEAHATWGGVAARWYSLASDRHPAIGRLYHHLGILERPSLRKLCYYAKSLTCVIPFPNAMDSLKTLCAPIVQDERSIQSSSQSVEARIVTYYALNFSRGASEKNDAIGTNALELLCKQPSKIRELGAHLCVTSISALFEFGSSSNPLFNLYTSAVEQELQPRQDPSNVAPATDSYDISSLFASTPSPVVLSSNRFLFSTFDLVVRRLHLLGPIRDCLPYVHIMLVWLHSLHAIQARYDISLDTLPLDLSSLNWQGLARLLNSLAHEHPITARILDCSRDGTFIVPETKGAVVRPLPEDDLVRGLVWGQFYYPQGWFDGQTEDDGRTIEDKYTYDARAERVLWLGSYMAVHTKYLKYDAKKRLFEAAAPPSTQIVAQTAATSTHLQGQLKLAPAEDAPCLDEPDLKTEPGVSSSENSDDGYAMVKKPGTAVSERPSPPQKQSRGPRAKVAPVPPKTCSWTTSAARKGRHAKSAADGFKVAGEDLDMDSEIDGGETMGNIRTGYSLR